MIDPENIFQLKLTLTDSFPEIWRRVLARRGDLRPKGQGRSR